MLYHGGICGCIYGSCFDALWGNLLAGLDSNGDVEPLLLVAFHYNGDGCGVRTWFVFIRGGKCL